jgi:hypothetical protein
VRNVERPSYFPDLVTLVVCPLEGLVCIRRLEGHKAVKGLGIRERLMDDIRA